jgi:hypothetical protein
MTPQAIRSLMNQEPFLPFRVHMADGRAIEVLGRDYIAISPTGTTFAIGQKDGAIALLDVAGVASLEISMRAPCKTNRRKK